MKIRLTVYKFSKGLLIAAIWQAFMYAAIWFVLMHSSYAHQ